MYTIVAVRLLAKSGAEDEAFLRQLDNFAVSLHFVSMYTKVPKNDLKSQ